MRKCRTLLRPWPSTVVRRRLARFRCEHHKFQPENGQIGTVPRSYVDISRKFSTSAPKTRINKQSTDGIQRWVSSLRKKTEPVVASALGSWSRKNVAVGRALMEDWLHLPPSHKDRAEWSTKILDRWVHECRSQIKDETAVVSKTHNELVDMLHRVLSAWRIAVMEGVATDAKVFQQSLALVNDLEAIYQENKDERLRPVDQSYTILLNILALVSQKVPHSCDQAMELLNFSMKRRKSGQKNHPDLLLCNACLHVLAKCSVHEMDAPNMAENLLNCMAKGTPFELSEGTMTPPKPDVVSFSTVLNAWANSPLQKAAQNAEMLLYQMKNQPDLPDPNLACYNTVLAAHGRSQQRGSARRAQNLLDSMQQSCDREISPDHISFLLVLSAWAKDSDETNAAENAEALLERMQRLYHETGNNNVRPTASCYALVLDAWSKRPESGPKVEALLEAMENSQVFSAEEVEEQMQPTVVNVSDPIKTAYIAAIRAWGNTTSDTHATDRAAQWLALLTDRSAKDEIEPNNQLLQAYAEAIRAWSKSSRADAPKQALSILRQMEELGLEPDTFVYNNTLNVLAQNGDAESALSLLGDMEEAHTNGHADAQPDAISYTTVIKALARSQDFPEAADIATEVLEDLIEIYMERREESMRPTEVTYASVILAWCNSGEMDCGEQAERVLWSMLDLSQRLGNDTSFPQPNTAICNSVLLAWSRAADPVAPSRAEELLSWMQDQVRNGTNPHVPPDRRTYNYLLKTWARSKRATSARLIEEHLDHMIHASKNKQTHPLYPDAFSYNCLLEAIKNSQRKDKAEQCYGLLKQLLHISTDSKSQRLWDLQSFHQVLMACMPSSNENDSRPLRNVIFQTLEELQSVEDPSFRITTTTLTLILRSYCATGASDLNFLRSVLQQAHAKIDNFALSSLKLSVPEHIYDSLVTLEEKMRDKTRRR